MNSRNPKVSVITVCRNSQKTIEETIKSVLEQSYKNVEYIIIDGGSTDGTIEIIKKYSDRLAYWVSESDNGMYDALYKGFCKSTGEILCWINADDFYCLTAIEAVVTFMASRPDVKWVKGLDVVYNSNSIITNVDMPIVTNKTLLRKGYYQAQYKLPYIQQESTFWHRDLMKTVDMSVFRSFRLAGDYYLWYCFSKETEPHIITSYLGGFRKHSGQLSESIKEYSKEIGEFCDNHSLIDRFCASIHRLFHSLFRGGWLYRNIYRHRIHHWDNGAQRFN